MNKSRIGIFQNLGGGGDYREVHDIYKNIFKYIALILYFYT